MNQVVQGFSFAVTSKRFVHVHMTCIFRDKCISSFVDKQPAVNSKGYNTLPLLSLSVSFRNVQLNGALSEGGPSL